MKKSIVTSIIFLSLYFLSSPLDLAANPLKLWAPGKPRAIGRVEITGNPGRDYYIEVGPWTYRYENGQKEKEGAFTRGIKTGPWRYWYKNGILMKEGSYDQLGREEGLWEYRYPNGLPEKKGTYREGVPDGHWTFRYNQTEPSLKMEGTFRRGQKDGFWIYRYPNGQKEKEGSYRNGLEDGLWSYWYPDGTMKCSGSFQEGLEEGEWIFRKKIEEDGEKKIREWRHTFREIAPYPGERKMRTFSDVLVGHWLTEKTIASMEKAHQQPVNPNHIFIDESGHSTETLGGRMLVTDWVIEDANPIKRTIQVRFTLDNGKGAVLFGRFSEDYKQLAGRYYLVDFLRGSRGRLINPFRFTYAGTEAVAKLED